jgi:hypothetical protein
LSSSKCPVFLHVLTGGVAGKNVWKGKRVYEGPPLYLLSGLL